MPVKQIGEDAFEVSNFLTSMPNLVYQVQFDKGMARVIAREGWLGQDWDRFAIQTVQSYILTGES